MSIKGYCVSNLDNFSAYTFPTRFAAVPRRGERVRAKTGQSLYVAGVTHEHMQNEPVIEVELTNYEQIRGFLNGKE